VKSFYIRIDYIVIGEKMELKEFEEKWNGIRRKYKYVVVSVSNTDDLRRTTFDVTRYEVLQDPNGKHLIGLYDDNDLMAIVKASKILYVN